ncbi:MAG: porin [Flavobacteriales bacterium]|nr:porin [Flavobacteriales bacterium]
MKKFIVLLFISSIYSASSQDITNNRFGKGLINVFAKDSSWSSKVAFRYQTRYEGNYDLVDSDYTGRAFVRRARIKGNGFAFSPKITYKFEYDVANGYVLDAVVKWNFTGNCTVWFGQTKLPGNIERVFSSQKLQLVDRSLLNSKFTLDRDAGAQLRHHFKLGNTFLVREIFAVSQGEGLNDKSKSTGNGYTGRIELLPFGNFTKKGDYFAADLKREKTPKLMLSATYDFNQNAMLSRGQKGDYLIGDLENLQTLFIDAHFKYQGFSFFGEYVDRKTSDGSPLLENSFVNGESIDECYYTGESINLQLGYLMKNNWEIAGRYTNVNANDLYDNNDLNQYTIGFSKYVVGHNLKVQTDFSYTTEQGENDKLLFRLQTEFNF